MSLTTKERFEAAQSVDFDIRSIAEIKLGVAANNTGAGIVKTLYSENINLRPETEATLNENLMTAINEVLNTFNTTLQEEFDQTMNPPLS